MEVVLRVLMYLVHMIIKVKVYDILINPLRMNLTRLMKKLDSII